MIKGHPCHIRFTKELSRDDYMEVKLLPVLAGGHAKSHRGASKRSPLHLSVGRGFLVKGKPLYFEFVNGTFKLHLDHARLSVLNREPNRRDPLFLTSHLPSAHRRVVLVFKKQT